MPLIHRQATLTNEGIHRASVALGNGLLRLVVDAYADRMSDKYLTLLRAIKDEVCPGAIPSVLIRFVEKYV